MSSMRSIQVGAGVVGVAITAVVLIAFCLLIALVHMIRKYRRMMTFFTGNLKTATEEGRKDPTATQINSLYAEPIHIMPIEMKRNECYDTSYIY